MVTNNHVVENASEVSVTLDDGKTLPATIVGTDKKTDLSYLKIKQGGSYQHVDFSTATPRVGDWVVAVGNPFGLSNSVTAGIVSSIGRDIGAGNYNDFIQIDAPINRGNSGGPTFDLRGQVIGMNSMIFSPSGGSVGIGFAIPAATAQTVIHDLKDQRRGRARLDRRPNPAGHRRNRRQSWPQDRPRGSRRRSSPNSPARAAGIKSGDVILGVDGERVDGPRELARGIAALGPTKKPISPSGTMDRREPRTSSSERCRTTRKRVQIRESAATMMPLRPRPNLAPASSVEGAGSNGVVVADVDQMAWPGKRGSNRRRHPLSRPVAKR